MNAEPSKCISDGVRACAACGGPLTVTRPWQRFCSTKCRNDYDRSTGTGGKVAAVRKVKRGASVVIHLEGPAAERALNLGLGERVRVVREP